MTRVTQYINNHCLEKEKNRADKTKIRVSKKGWRDNTKIDIIKFSGNRFMEKLFDWYSGWDTGHILQYDSSTVNVLYL